MAINERNLNKGHVRKLTALRKSLGQEIADEAFEKWLAQQSTGAAEKVDPIAVRIEELLAPVANDTKFRLGRYGYTIRRAKGKGAAKGFVAVKNDK